MSSPAVAGPTQTRPWTIVEFRAMALARSSRSVTISTRNACRAGMSNALISPWNRLRAMISADVDDVRQRQPGQHERLDIARTCVTTMSRGG